MQPEWKKVEFKKKITDKPTGERPSGGDERALLKCILKKQILIRGRWAGHVARMEKKGINTLNIVTGKPTGKRPSEMHRLRCEDIIRVNLKEIRINTRNWVDSAQDRDYWGALINAALNLRFFM